MTVVSRSMLTRSLFWASALVAMAGLSVAIFVYGQQQVFAVDRTVLEMATVVTGPPASNNIDSNVNIAPNDEVFWVLYYGATQTAPDDADANLPAVVGKPQAVKGSVSLPADFVWQNTVAGTNAKGPPNITFNWGGTTAEPADGAAVTSVAWEQQPLWRVPAAGGPKLGTWGPINFDVNLDNFFKCDPLRTTLVAWDKLRFDTTFPVGTGGLKSVSVTIQEIGASGFFIAPDPAEQPQVLDFTTAGASAGKWIDISMVSRFKRKLRFQVTFTATDPAIDLQALQKIPFDVTWRGDQPQVCFVAKAPNKATLDDKDYKSRARVDWYSTLTEGSVPVDAKAERTASVGQSFNPNGTNTGNGPTLLGAALPNSDGGTTTVLLQTRYDLRAGTGDMLAFQVNDQTIADSPYASAAAAVQPPAGASPNRTDRGLFTSRIGADGISDSGGRTDLLWGLDGIALLDQPVTGLQKAFNTQYNGTSDTLGEARLNYVRGDRSNEGTAGEKFRARNSILGPVVNSAPVLLPSSPEVGYPEAQFRGYTNFRKNIQRGNNFVMYGGHDGMTHGFSVTDSKMAEAFGFLPNKLIAETDRFLRPVSAVSGVKTLLGITPYAIDSTPMIRDVALQPDPTTVAWRSIMVNPFGTRRRGILATDITTRFSGSTSDLGYPFKASMWTYTPDVKADPPPVGSTSLMKANDLRDLGQIVYNPPIDANVGAEQIVRVPNITSDPALPTTRWAAVIGNGIKSQIGPDPSSNGTGRAVLYMFYFGFNNNYTDRTVPWQDTWLRIPVSESDSELAYNNGLMSARPVDINGDGTADVVYAGDLKGNLWRFDIRNLPSVTVKRLFTTDGKQPITSAPVVRQFTGTSSCNASKTCYMVVFGTGFPINPLTPGPENLAQQHYLYGVLDDVTPGSDMAPGTVTKDSAAAIDSGSLLDQPLDMDTGRLLGIRSVASNAIDWSKHKGWKISLWEGEQMVANIGVTTNNQALFTTGRYLPFMSSAGYRPQRSWLTQVDFFTGSGLSKVFNNNGTQASSFSVLGTVYETPLVLPSNANARTESLVLQIASDGKQSGNTGFTLATRNKPLKALGRLSWREILGEQ